MSRAWHARRIRPSKRCSLRYGPGIVAGTPHNVTNQTRGLTGIAYQGRRQEMIVCVPVDENGVLDPRWGRANHVAVADVRSGEIADWQDFEVRWGELHDEGAEGSHHARIVRFLLEHKVQAVVANHMGPGMLQTLGKMGVQLHLGATGDARRAVRTMVSA